MSVDQKASVPPKTSEATEMAHLGPTGDQTKRKPKYYEGVYMNDRTISTNGNVTPDLLRSPVSRGLFNLPRYVPRYTINSRLRGNYSADDDDNVSGSKPSRTVDRKYKDYGKDHDSDYFGEVPVYRERPDGVESGNGVTKETKKRKEVKKLKKTAESEQRKACCSECCAAECCTPKCRRCACIFIVLALVAAALLAVALGLYFGYFMQYGDSYAMKLNFTVVNATFPSYLSDLTNPDTMNLTNSICRALQKTLEDETQFHIDVSSCSAVSYTNGSVNALFNIDVRHRRDEFVNSGDAFYDAVCNRVRVAFQMDKASYFAQAVSSSILSGYNTRIYFNMVLNEMSAGHFSPALLPPTLTPSPTNPSTINSNARTTPKYTVTSTGNSAGANMNGNTTNCGNHTAAGCGNNTADATTSGNSTGTASNASAISCGNNTGAISNANGTNCGNNTSVAADNILNTTSPTSYIEASSIPSNFPSSSRSHSLDSSTNQPSSIQGPAVRQTRTTHWTTTSLPTANSTSIV